VTRFNTTPCYTSWIGGLTIAGWHGLSVQEVTVVGETPKRYRILAGPARVKLAGERWLEPFTKTLVPRGAVRFLRFSGVPARKAGA
jgi:hypothetical protein